MPGTTFNAHDTINAESSAATVMNNRFVTRIAGGLVARTLASAAADGVVLDRQAAIAAAFNAGEAVPVCPGGVIPVEAGAAVADFAEVMSDATGRAITFVAGGGALALGRVTNGSSAGAAGDLLAVSFYPRTAQHI